MQIFSGCTKPLRVFFSLILVSISYFPTITKCTDTAISTDPLSTLVTDSQKDYLEKLLLDVLDQLKMINATIEDLATVVSNDIVKKIKDKSDHVTKLRLTREIITPLTTSTYVVIDEFTIYNLIHIARSITNFLLDSIDDGFYELNYFDLGYIQIPQVNFVTIEDLQKELEANSELLSELDYKAANVGLCWYNKIYRTAKKRIARPWHKYHLGPILTVGSIASVTGLLLWWQFDIKFPQRLRDLKIPGTNKRIFGPTPRFDAAGNIIRFYDNGNIIDGHQMSLIGNQTNPIFQQCLEKLGLMGSLELITAELFFSNQAPITSKMSLLTATIAGYIAPTARRWASQKVKEFDNFMMGGAYRHRPVGDIQYLSKVNFDDVIGCDEPKEIGKTLCMYLKDPERFDRAKLTPAKGYLLVGETRTGKSYFVEALLGELQRDLGSGFGGFKIYKISYAEIEARGIEYILSLAKDVAPCILFIDEIDLLGLQRSQDRKRLSEFLTAMSGYLSEIDPDKAVIIVGATNKQESIDFALTQPGRFGVIIPFERPNYNERKEYIKRELTKLAVNLNLFDIDKLARETEGYVFEAIGLVIKKAMIKAKTNNEPISQALLEKSFDETIRGILEDTKTIPEAQKEMLAAHQAGHALVNILLDPHLKLNKVTIQKIRANVKEQAIWIQAWQKEDEKQKAIEYGKLFFSHEKDALEFENKEELIKQCKVMLAGHIAEQILLGTCSYSYHAEDRQRALKMAQSTVIGGLQLDQLPKDVKNKYLTEAYNLMTQCEQEVEALLKEHHNDLAKLTNALKEKGTLGISEINTILNSQSQETKANKETDSALSEILAKQKTAGPTEQE